MWKSDGCHPYGAFGEDKAVKDGADVIARVFHTGDENETVQRAKVLAAAPELLSALESFVWIMNMGAQLPEKVRNEALNKATELARDTLATLRR